MYVSIVHTLVQRLLLVAFFFGVFIGIGSAEQLVIERKEFERLVEKVERLERQLSNQGSAAIAEKSTVNPSTQIELDVEDNRNRLDEVEKKTLLDKVEVGFELRTRVDVIDVNSAVDAGGKDVETEDLFSNRFRLNLRSEVTEDLIFQSRLAVFKLWGESNFDEPFSDIGPRRLSNEDGELHVEKAYVDWFIPNSPFSLTVGRIPVAEGPPIELRNNTKRRGTYPALLIDGESDGIVLNTRLDEYIGLNSSIFRVVYSKISQNFQALQGNDLDDTRALHVDFETELPGFDDSLFWLSWTRAFDIQPAPLDVATSAPSSVGDVEYYNAHLQLMDIMDSGLDLFVSYAASLTDAGSSGTIAPAGTLAPIPIELCLLGTNIDGTCGKNRDGHIVYAGFRYELPVESVNYPKLGFEFTHASKYWLSGASGEDLISKTGLLGETYEVYYIQPVNRYLFFRGGLVFADENYNNPGALFGSPQKTDEEIINYYLLMDVIY